MKHHHPPFYHGMHSLRFSRVLAAAGACFVLTGWAWSQNAPASRQPLTPTTATTKTNAPATSTSATKQFIIHGADLHTRSAFSLLSEDVSGSLGRLLKDDARFTVPVVVDLHTPPDMTMTGPTVTIDMSVVENSVFHFGLIVQLRADFRTEDYTRELVRVLLVERILRDHPQVQTTRRPILPDWVATGVMQALEFRSRSRPSAMFAAVFRSRQFYDVEKIFTVNTTSLDAVSRSIFDTSSCALVLALLDQPEGPMRFAKFLSALAIDSKTDRELLQQSFPNFSTSRNSLEKWWTLQMATLATPNALESMTVEDTEAKLDAVLTLRFDETPEEAAKNAKKSGGILGWFSGSKSKENPPSAETKTPAAKEKPEKNEATSSEEKPRSGVFRGLFSSSKTKEEEAGKSLPPKDEPKKPDKPKEQAKAAKAEKSSEPPKAEEGKPKTGGFFSGIFGGKSESKEPKPEKKSTKEVPAAKDKKESDEKPREPTTFFGGRKIALPLPPCDEDDLVDDGISCAAQEKEETPPALPKKARRASDRPAELPAKAETSAPKEEKKDEGDKKPSKLNPLNWFNKSDKKPEEAAPKKPVKEEPKKATPKPAENKATPATAPLEDFQRIWQRKDRNEILKKNLDQLASLKLRAHPLFRPLIGGYSEQVQRLIEGKDKGVADKLDTLRKRRVELHELARAVESHLDWYEATQVQTRSGFFDDYLKLRDQMDKEVRPRTDEISKYLDSLAKEFEE